MEGLEADIAIYLTIDRQVFIAPQFDIKWEMNEGGACPDFVALDFKSKEVVVVEVTAAADWKPLSARVTQREERWFRPVGRILLVDGIITPEWKIRFLGFVRETAVPGLEKQFAGVAGVTFTTLENSTLPWKYWKNRMEEGLPGKGHGLPITSV